MAKGVKGFQPGESGNKAGKPIGAKSAKTKAWDKLGEAIVNEGAERFMTILEGKEEDEFLKNYLMILEYFKPKQQRSEVIGNQRIEIDYSGMTTEELKQRAEALKTLNDS